MKTKESKGFLQKAFNFNARLISRLGTRIGNNGDKAWGHLGGACEAFEKANIPKVIGEIARANKSAWPMAAEISLALPLLIVNAATRKLAKNVQGPLVAPPKP